MLRPALHSPLPALRVNNNLPLWSSVSDPSSDRVDLSRPPCAASGIWVNSMDGPALLFWECHPWPAKLRLRVPKIRISVRASFFGAMLTARPAVPRGCLLASMSDPKLLALMITSLGTLIKPQWRLLWGNLKAYFMIQFPGRTAWGFAFEPSSSTSSITRTSATPTTP